MTEQSTASTAFRLADRLESDLIRSQTMLDAAAELRRLAAVEAQRDAMLEALNSFLYEFGDKANSATVQKARAAIKAVEE